MSEKTVRELEIELAEERGRRKALEEILLAQKAAPQFIPVPYAVPSAPSYPQYYPTQPNITFETVPTITPPSLDKVICERSRFSVLEINSSTAMGIPVGLFTSSSGTITSSH